MIRKIWRNVKEFCFILWFFWIIMSPLFVMKAILILSKYLTTYSAFLICIFCWAAILITGAALCVKPWKKKKHRAVKRAVS